MRLPVLPTLLLLTLAHCTPVGVPAADAGVSAANVGVSAANVGVSAANVGVSAANVGVSAADASAPTADAGLAASRALTVQVFGLDGAPLAGSQVQVVAETLEDHNLWLEADERGAASTPAPAPGRYRVLAYWLLKGKFQRYVWQDLDVKPGTEDLRVELRFARGSAAPISGRVRGLDDQPVAGAEVQAWQLASSVPLDGDLLRNSSSARETVSATTDAEGRFTLEPLREGEYGLQVRHSPAGLGDTYARTGGPAVELQLVPRCVRSASGRVVDERGAPIKSFEVGSRRVRDAKGHFQLKGDCYVTVEARGFVSQDLPVLSLKGLHVELPDVVLERGRQLTGRVLGPDGKPLKDVDLKAYWAGPTPGSTSESTDAGGRVSLGPVPAGREVTVWAKWNDKALRQQVAPGKDAKVELRFPAEDSRLEVLTKDAQGAPLGGMQVQAQSAWGFLTLTTDKTGRAAQGVPAGSYEVRVTHKPSGRPGARRVAYRFDPVSVQVSPESTPPVEVRATQGTGRLRVILPEGTHYDAIFVVPGAHDWPADIPAWSKLLAYPMAEDAVSSLWMSQAPALIYYETQNDFSELVPGPYTVFAGNPQDDGPGLLAFRQVIEVDGRGRQVVQVRFSGDGSRRLHAVPVSAPAGAQ
ncbi:MSCRAMM family protein [Pyxidicoccus trucidator]|uniref:MSCRAMM family protein n=1 Tax=Pyxidicoccus trucidator TaxID=2709662 RepID=UPI0013D9ED0B|nr:carboxypeptidase regulatory-like domain-containing protein [Pyxidicoccus trucidator]